MARTPRRLAPSKRSQPPKKPRNRPVSDTDAAIVASTEFKRILNCVPSKKVENDWRLSHAISAGVLSEVPIPSSKDLREGWWSINDQKATGSCVGWATADSVVRWHFVKSGRLKPNELLSPRFIWMAAKETDEFNDRPSTFVELDGTSLKAALDVARKFGCVTNDVLPFESGQLYQGEADTLYAIASQRRIANYFNLGRNPSAWRRWIATKGPILTRLTCDKVWMSAKSTAGRLEVYDESTADGGHAVALVGYDEGCFVVRNSWGTANWGDKGFAYASNGYAAAAFTEAYGVSV